MLIISNIYMPYLWKSNIQVARNMWLQEISFCSLFSALLWDFLPLFWLFYLFFFFAAVGFSLEPYFFLAILPRIRLPAPFSTRLQLFLS